MSMTENRKIVTEFLETYGDTAVAERLLAEDATWTYMVNPTSIPGIAPMDRKVAMGLIASVKDNYPEGIRFTISGMTAENDRVAVEAACLARTAAGKEYNNLFHFLFVLKDGKICAVREYNDSIHAMSV